MTDKTRNTDTPTQAELAQKALDLKRKAERDDTRETMAEEGTPLHPQDPDAGKGNKANADTASHDATPPDEARGKAARDRLGPRSHG